MPDKPDTPRRSPAVIAFAVLAALTVVAWFIAGFTGCRHAGLV